MPVVATTPPGTVNLAWLVKLRWGAIGGQVATIAVVDRLFHIALPIPPLVAIVMLELASNLAVRVWAQRKPAAEAWRVASLMALDIVLFTAMLFLTGGPFNPFSSLYLVHIALAALVFRSAWSWGLMALAMLCFGGLFLDYRMLPELQHDMGGAGHTLAAHPHGGGAEVHLHLRGMWVAFTIAAGFIVHFLRRIRSDLAERDTQLAQAQAAAARSERLAALATLAAGAAHELSTPLSTIAVVARELARTTAMPASGDSDLRADVQLIRDEVDRCREILQRMAADAGQSAGEPFTKMALGTLLDAVLLDVPEANRVGVDVAPVARDLQLNGPERALQQAIRGVVKNALQATQRGGQVRMTAYSVDGELRIIVADTGVGMDAADLERAGEPFFTTKEPGAGMGLGLFLTRTVIERLGGQLALESMRLRGTVATLTLPIASERQRNLAVDDRSTAQLAALPPAERV